MRSLIRLQNLFEKTKKVVNVMADIPLMFYVMWMIKSDDLRSKMDGWVMRMDMNIKDREGK